MNNVLPPQGGLVVNGVIYNYTVDKEVNDPLKVHVQNENVTGDGYIFRETDDWSGLPGNTINKIVGIENIPKEYFGNGSIETEGIGSVSDPSVVYTYRYDECFVVLSNPKCPGYLQALYEWLKENGLLGEDLLPGDPFYDEWVQANLNRETIDDYEDEKIETEEKEEDDPGITALNANVNIKGFVDGAKQQAMILQMSTIPNFENYYTVIIQGGVYNDTVIMQDSKLPDNGRAMRSLASDATHRQMVRSQYDDK